MNILLSSTLNQIKLYYINNIIIFSNNFLIIKFTTNNCTISKRLKYIVYENTENNIYKPLFFVPKLINNTEEFLNDFVYDFKKLSIIKNHGGSYIILFNSDNCWYFSLNYNIYLFDKNIHPLLYNCLEKHIPNLQKDLCYHIMLNDIRIRKNILPQNETINEIILLKITNKYLLTENNSNTTIKKDKNFYVSCIDELYFRIDEIDNKNNNLKKLLHFGYIVKISTDFYISFNSNLLNKLKNLFSHKILPKLEYLYLYQNNNLNTFFFLLNSNVSNNDVIDRINNSFNTLSKEILDIYHLTRNKKNSNLYNSLHSSYRKFIYILHNNYKNNYEKASLNINDVYLKLKELSVEHIAELFINRKNILNYKLKNCSDTNIQAYLLN